MGQLEDYWIPKSIFDEELKRRQDAEKRLDEVLRYLDPQPSGGPIYMAPFPEPGDLGERMVVLAERWEREAAQLRQGTEYADVAESMGDMAKQLRTALGEHAAKGTEKPRWFRRLDPEAAERREAAKKGGVVTPKTRP
jgi:hypothetical protein